MNRFLFALLVNRDGEMISLSRYSPCMEEECECNYSSGIPNPGKESAWSSAVSLQFHRGFYHDRYSDVTKVSLSTHLGENSNLQYCSQMSYPFYWTVNCFDF